MTKKIEVIERLRAKWKELDERIKNHWSGGGSQKKELLEYKRGKIFELIRIYQKKSEKVDFAEVKKSLEGWTGFETAKKKILDTLEVEDFIQENNLKKTPFVIAIIGSSGTGKTTFGKYLSSILKRKFFSINLNELSKDQFWGSESSFGSEVGQLTKALLESDSPEPLILLDEIDKAPYSLKNILVNVLDVNQNEKIIDHFLDVRLDFSKSIFLITANEKDKIPPFILSRIGNNIIQSNGYNLEEKKEIAQKFIQEYFSLNLELGKKIKITAEAFEILINKTKEKGVRQLVKSLEGDVINFCLKKWAEEKKQGKEISQINIDSILMEKIVDCSFFEIDKEENLIGEDKLEIMKIQLWLLLREKKDFLGDLEYENYEEKIISMKSKEEANTLKSGIDSIDNSKRKNKKDLEGKISELERKIENTKKILDDKFSGKNLSIPVIGFSIWAGILLILILFIRKQKNSLKIKKIKI